MYERIRALCNELGYSIPALETLAGLSNGAIGKWRSSIPRADVLDRVASILHTTSEYLLHGNGPAHPQERNVPEIIAHEDGDIAAYLQKAKDEERIMFDLVRGASIDEIKATVTFLKMLRNHGMDSE